MKTCNKCGEEKATDQFYSRPRNRGGLSHQCKSCEIAVTNAWRQRNRGRVNAAARQRKRPAAQTKRYHLWSFYRTTPERFDAILAQQGGSCAICGADEPGGRGSWHVDHDHSCCPGWKSCGACVRGLLCSRCNPMIGMAKDDASVLLAAAEYLNNAAVNALGAIGSVA